MTEQIVIFKCEDCLRLTKGKPRIIVPYPEDDEILLCETCYSERAKKGIVE